MSAASLIAVHSAGGLSRIYLLHPNPTAEHLGRHSRRRSPSLSLRASAGRCPCGLCHRLHPGVSLAKCESCGHILIRWFGSTHSRKCPGAQSREAEVERDSPPDGCHGAGAEGVLRLSQRGDQPLEVRHAKEAGKLTPRAGQSIGDSGAPELSLQATGALRSTSARAWRPRLSSMTVEIC